MRHFVTALLQAAQCSGYRAQLPTSASGFDSRLGYECVMQYAGTGKKTHEAIFFLLQNLALQLGLGQRCQPEGIAVT